MLPCLLETCFLKASLQYGKNVGVFLTSVQLTALEAKLKTHWPSAETLKFVLYTAAWRRPCWKQK